MYRKVTLKLVLCLCLFLVSVKRIQAADFSLDNDVFFTVLKSGLTQVRQNVTLTNLSSNFIAQNYTLSVNSERLENIQASSPNGIVTTQILKQRGQTIITLSFPLKVAGLGKKLNFSLTYDARDIAEKKGRIWEILIPGIEKNEETKSYTLHLSVPPEFGRTIYFYPPPKSGGVWTLEDLQGGGVTAAYGDYQNFTFNLKYDLENLSDKANNQEITLPPDTSYQRVILKRLSHLPLNIRLDEDGNWLAQYRVQAHGNLTIFAEGNVLVNAFPSFMKPIILTKAERDIYTKDLPFWEKTPEIIHKADELKNIKNIYLWVVKTLSYDYNRLVPQTQRLGATNAFTNPQSAICTEFTDLFIALARANNIPSREIQGFAYTDNIRLQPLSLLTDVLHAWPEYYDEKLQTWVQVDPTWENTTRGVDYFSKLDFNHVALAILGHKSDSPQPAGAFKNTVTKNVFIDFDTSEIQIPDPKYKVEFLLPAKLIAGKKYHGSIKVKNTGQVFLKTSPVNITGVQNQRLNTGLSIPPGGYVLLDFNYVTPVNFFNHTPDLVFTIEGHVFHYAINSRHIILKMIPYLYTLKLITFIFLIIYFKHKRAKA